MAMASLQQRQLTRRLFNDPQYEITNSAQKQDKETRHLQTNSSASCLMLTTASMCNRRKSRPGSNGGIRLQVATIQLVNPACNFVCCVQARVTSSGAFHFQPKKLRRQEQPRDNSGRWFGGSCLALRAPSESDIGYISESDFFDKSDVKLKLRKFDGRKKHD